PRGGRNARGRRGGAGGPGGRSGPRGAAHLRAAAVAIDVAMPPRPLLLTPQLFAIFSGLIEEHAGLHYAPGDRDLLEHKLVARASDAGFESLLDYYYFLRYDPGGPTELEALIDALV